MKLKDTDFYFIVSIVQGIGLSLIDMRKIT